MVEASIMNAVHAALIIESIITIVGCCAVGIVIFIVAHRIRKNRKERNNK
jgi:hypothetical protein